MYQLYIDKNNYTLRVTKILPAFKGFISYECDENEVITFNSHYKLSKNKESLVQTAQEIKALWLSEAMMTVQKIKEIKI